MVPIKKKNFHKKKILTSHKIKKTLAPKQLLISHKIKTKNLVETQISPQLKLKT